MNLSEFDPGKYLPLIIVSIGWILILSVMHFFLIFRQQSLSSEERFPRQLLMLGLTLLAIVILVVVAPLSETTRNQMLTLLGIVISGVIAFSSTSFVTNFMAAIVLRVTQPFKIGDFVTIDGNFGKVVSRGLLDTEIQTETRELIAIPNSSFTSRSIKVARRSGIIVTSSVSLGYDIAHTTVEQLMLVAATNSGLQDPYVHVIELGNFAVTYRVAGLLTDVERILTTRSELNRQILDVTHGAGLEIMSPSVTRYITQEPETRITPQPPVSTKQQVSADAEEIIFDKARAIEQLETEKQQLIEQIEVTKNTSGNKGVEDLQLQLQAIKEQEKQLKEE